MADEGFFSRWSRLKSDARTQPPEVQQPAAAPAPDTDGAQRHMPTLEDVQQLGRDSDYSAFVAPDVDPSVRRLALRKLFADPHFNVRDGLDVYMGDYTRPSPMPAAMLASLAHAGAWLGLGPEREQQGTQAASGDAAVPAKAGIHTEPATPLALQGSAVIPAKAGIHTEPATPVAQQGCAVIPAKAGIHTEPATPVAQQGSTVIPAKAGIHTEPATPLAQQGSAVIPAKAGIHTEPATPVAQHGSQHPLGRRATESTLVAQTSAPAAAPERDEH